LYFLVSSVWVTLFHKCIKPIVGLNEMPMQPTEYDGIFLPITRSRVSSGE
jgi:hypothetical protein